MAELENSMDRQEADNRNKMDVTMAKLHDKTTETTSLRMDNERLKVLVDLACNKRLVVDKDLNERLNVVVVCNEKRLDWLINLMTKD